MSGGFPGRRWIAPDDVSWLQLFLAMYCGSLLGWTPTLATLHTALLLLLLVFIRVPILLLLLTAGLCWTLGAFAIDPVIDMIGQKILSENSLLSLWTQLYNAPLLPWTQFSNSMVMGAAGLASAFIPLWLIMSWKLRSMAQTGKN
jgi:uncharacterized protein (TIGR03546 family)